MTFLPSSQSKVALTDFQQFILIILILLLTASLRWFLGASFPMTNDEAYYWDWGRDLKLSYFDHPPAVAWMTWFSQQLGSGLLEARFLSPLAHAIASLFLFLSLRELSPNGPQSYKWWLLAATQLAPGLSLWGTLALPDTVLLPLASALLFFVLRWRSQRLSIFHSVFLGTLLGLSGCAKYHALPVCGGLILGFAFERRKRIREDLKFWFVTFVFALLMTSPVWIWNFQNGFASFRFQSDHGFAKLSFKPLFFFRALVGEFLLITPLIFFKSFRAACRRPIAFGGFFPLVALILGVSAFKQVLPHWILPAFWVTLPFAVTELRLTRGAKRQLLCFGIMTWTIPWILSITSIREKILEFTKGDPGPMAELSLWPFLADTLVKQEHFGFKEQVCRKPSVSCNEKIIVSQRWFWGAQLAFYLPHHPFVRVLDRHRGSYYDDRDDWRKFKGCEVLVVVDGNHRDEAYLSKYLQLSSPWENLKVPYHEKIEIFYAYAVVKDLDSSGI